MRFYISTAAVLCAAFSPLALAAAQSPGGAAASPNIAGAWVSTFGETDFLVTDRRDTQGRVIAKDVRGAYKTQDGKIAGELRGRGEHQNGREKRRGSGWNI